MDGITDLGNLNSFCREVEELFKKRFQTKQKVSIAICFALPPEYDTCHWISL
jgi:PleD family two-component response regulator